MADVQSVTAENRQGKQDRRKKKKKPQDENIRRAAIIRQSSGFSRF